MSECLKHLLSASENLGERPGGLSRMSENTVSCLSDIIVSNSFLSRLFLKLVVHIKLLPYTEHIIDKPVNNKA